MEQIAVFTNPAVKSSVTGNLNAKKAKGGIKCILTDAPKEPGSDAIFKKGEWQEVSSAGHTANSGSSFKITLDANDDATYNLLSCLRTKKNIEEIVIYQLNTTDNKEQYGHYFSKVFVHEASTPTIKGKKTVILECSCISFKQRDQYNNEPVLWDWDTNTHIYTGATR